MYIVSLSYKVSNEIIDQHLQEHVEFLNRQYEQGNFIASGRKVPRTGGIIIAKMESKELLMDVLRQDPFHKHELANYEVTEFIPSKVAAGLESLMD